ncbi:MAG: multifunctional oxoglutarate decarboxylase/oxoglutarate dehydrogenase thiamine pyrophosphate-binding subunit/dihydrolipoyllysine-residue succinyltransferase subunit [Ardenticatenaceae bacterium]
MNVLPESVLEQFGANAEYVADLYSQWRYSPVSVAQEWRRYFEELRVQEVAPVSKASTNGSAQRAAPAKQEQVSLEEEYPTGVVVPAALVEPELASYEEAQRIRGVASLIVDNMQQSLGVPVATSQRSIPVKVLEENRRIINQTLVQTGRKVSFTHVIAWAIIEALESFPQLNSAYAVMNGKPHRILRHDVNFGLAIDMERRDGSRSLIVPNIKAANRMNFDAFLNAYYDVLVRARTAKLTTNDYYGTTITLTNPGTIGTIASVPRLMQGQGLIVAVGVIGYPAEYSATAPEILTELGISKVMGITSTYDHRIIQGAESGMFLAKIHQLLLGEDNFYDRIFRDLRVPYPSVRWERDKKPLLFGQANHLDMAEKQACVLQLINAYRMRGHLLANLDPLTAEPKEYHPDLDPATYGLTLWDLDREFITGGLAGVKRTTLRHILDILRRTYSSKFGLEFMNIQNPEEREWLQQKMELPAPPKPLSDNRRHNVLQQMSNAEAFERFLHRRYVGSKRFSLEGGETTIPMLGTIFDRAAQQGIEEAVLGMAHRGRLNILHNIMQKPASAIFSEFEGQMDPETIQGSGDVKYHLGTESIRNAYSGEKIKLVLAPNPSHLEAVNPVVVGMAHAKQRQKIGTIDGLATDKVLPVLIHGDAAFAGQGIVAETLNLAELRGYRAGGTIHLIINNQIGFTTNPLDARSTPFASDIAKMSQIPIFHVNGDDPEAAVRICAIALDYRQRFGKDVLIDLVCYRRWGHNEGDDPSYTQPRMYKLIEKRVSPREVYAKTLLRQKVITQSDAQRSFDQAIDVLEEGTKGLEGLTLPKATFEYGEYTDLSRVNPPHTAVARDTLIHISRVIANPPSEFYTHPKLKKLIKRRELKGDGSDRIDWATGEALAFGSLLLEGFPIRLSGEDSGRGTFSHRHSVLHNYETGEDYVPLNHLADGQPPFKVYDSMLSEAAVLGFEYGYSIAAPKSLVLWEAQFGDFANGAQVIIDQFISSSETKWGQRSDLVMLLPHGHEGQGPEHSSARLERYLQLCAENNMGVTYPTTSANYFHMLRRQKHDRKERPLIVMTPKSLLRLPAAMSPLEAFTEGNFVYVIDDASIHDPSRVKRIVFMSGKLYYDIAAKKTRDDVALVRVEQLYPYPRPAIRPILERYANASEIMWAQEEPRNQGAWSFINPFLKEDIHAVRGSMRLQYNGRRPSASTASGSSKIHQQEQTAIVNRALA